ncbi:MAG: CPBP family intramembrane metalloprotease [Actinomycetota bacterium]|nr:CPBP family intramembrane metalloprotease [Actinomycetota bacterium]
MSVFDRARRQTREIAGWLPRPITEQTPIVPRESPGVVSRRKRVVTVVGLTGAGLLGLSLSTKPGSGRFYLLTSAVAATWTVGAFASGPLHVGRIRGRDDITRVPIVTPVATGVAAFGTFYGLAMVARQIPFLESAIGNILRFADEGDLPLVILTTCANGIGEELFFRGALFATVRDEHPVVTSTALYTAATLATRNPALVAAAAFMGALFGVQRRASGGVQAPALTHLTWSVLMLRYLPPLFEKAIADEQRHDRHERPGD